MKLIIFLSWITPQFFDIKQLQVWFPMYDHYYTSVNYSMRGISISHPFPHSFTDSVNLRMARHRDLKECYTSSWFIGALFFNTIILLICTATLTGRRLYCLKEETAVDTMVVHHH